MNVRLQVEPGHSIILRTFQEPRTGDAAWCYGKDKGPAIPVPGPWQVEFIAVPAPGGLPLPKAYTAATLESWTKNGDPEAGRFAGTARYRTTFDLPASLGRPPAAMLLSLGDVRHSARVRLNGRELGTLIMKPYRMEIPTGGLQASGNLLEVEVTNLAANRIRDLDRRHANWKTFKDINLVNIKYKPFDAADWPVFDSGLLGPVTLVPQTP